MTLTPFTDPTGGRAGASIARHARRRTAGRAGPVGRAPFAGAVDLAHDPPDGEAPPRKPVDLAISVLNTFRFCCGGRLVNLPGNSRRLLALLALRDKPMTRLLVAGTLWPDATERDAASSLRSALWRLKGAVGDAVVIADLDLSLRPDVTVDLRESRALARRLLDSSAEMLPTDETAAAVAALSGDLLPGWYEDWTIEDAGEWHQLRLHALEALAQRLTAKCQYAKAVTAAIAAVSAEPLRESAHASLIRGLLAEGNQKEALDHFNRYRELLDVELGITPSDQFDELISGLYRRSA